jgi:hypothetical protein
MVRIALCLVVAVGACTPAQAPTARKVGKVLALGGVAGLIAAATTSTVFDHTHELIIGFSVISATGIGLYAAGELATPEETKETVPQRNHRWARILTERAAGAARDGRCPRVRRLESRVRVYDREIHDFVFMRDPEILKCMTLEHDLQVPDVADPSP